MATVEPFFSSFDFKVFETCLVVDTGNRSTYEFIYWFLLILSPVVIYSQINCCDVCKAGSQLHPCGFPNTSSCYWEGQSCGPLSPAPRPPRRARTRSAALSGTCAGTRRQCSVLRRAGRTKRSAEQST